MASSDLTKLTLPLVDVDPFAESAGNLLVIAFSKSPSPNFPLALSIARGATKFGTVDFGGQSVFLAVFARNQAEAGRAKALLNYVDAWKGTLLFAQGKMISNHYQISEVLNCYLEACSCTDTRAHCYQVIDDPASEVQQSFGGGITIRLTDKPTFKKEIKIDRYAFPCKLLRSWFKFQKDHPSSAQDQIQAAGVGRGCDVCPLFDPSSYTVVGTKSVYKEYPE